MKMSEKQTKEAQEQFRFVKNCVAALQTDIDMRERRDALQMVGQLQAQCRKLQGILQRAERDGGQ